MRANGLSIVMICGLLSPLFFHGDACYGQQKVKYKRTVEQYQAPEVTLLSQDRVKVPFRDIVHSGKPVALAFNYTTCTTVYPLIAAGFANLQRKLGPERGNVWLISISIDPEYDTPEVMKDYLRRYGAQPGWDFLTGSKQDIERIMRALNAYVPDKMETHNPLTFIWLPGKSECLRIFGLTGTRDLMAETGVSPNGEAASR